MGIFEGLAAGLASFLCLGSPQTRRDEPHNRPHPTPAYPHINFSGYRRILEEQEAATRAKAQSYRPSKPSTTLQPLTTNHSPFSEWVTTGSTSQPQPPHSHSAIQQAKQKSHPAPSYNRANVPPPDNHFSKTKAPKSKAQEIRPLVPAVPPATVKDRISSAAEEDENTPPASTDIGSDLRARAKDEGNAMTRCFEQARAARRRKDTGAKDLFDKAHAHKREMERLDKEASVLIIKESERRCKPGFIDLHGLYVKEAVEYTNESVHAAIKRGDPEIKIIVGKGNHSKDSIAKLKPEIEKWLLRHRYTSSLDPSGGMFIVNLQQQGGKKQPDESDPNLGNEGVEFF